MKNIHSLNVFIVLLLSIGLNVACSKKVEIEPVAEVRPVKTLIVSLPDSGGVRSFPARIDANRKAELAFRVAGKLQEILVKEGDTVLKDDVLARLEPTDFKIAVNDKKALFNRASKDYNRSKGLVKEGHISKMDFDKLESNFLSARAELNLAKQQLDYTELRAPFDGTVAKRYIQNFEEIQAKQEIISLNDNEILEVKFDLPENLIRRLKKIEGVDDVQDATLRQKIPVVATFQSKIAKEYPLEFKEMSTKADASTQTFAVTYTMPRPNDIVILPGMTAMIKINLNKFINNENIIYLPVSAVVADVNLQGIVWVVDEKTMQVAPVPVKVGTMKGNSIQINSGLQLGQRVVTAGVPFLYKGLKVNLMKDLEQATDNIKHSRPVMKDIQQAEKKG